MSQNLTRPIKTLPELRGTADRAAALALLRIDERGSAVSVIGGIGTGSDRARRGAGPDAGFMGKHLPQRPATSGPGTTGHRERIVKGIIHSQFTHRETKTYIVKNRSDQPRALLVEHPYRPDFKLMAPEKPAERSRDVYRFEVAAEPNKPVELVVVEELPRVEQVQLSNSTDDQVRVLMRFKASSDKVKAALKEALAQKGKIVDIEREVQKEELALKGIEQDQARMRANMERVPQTSEAYQRYLKKFDAQETEIEKRRARVVELQEKADREKKAYEEFLGNLTVE